MYGVRGHEHCAKRNLAIDGRNPVVVTRVAVWHSKASNLDCGMDHVACVRSGRNVRKTKLYYLLYSLKWILDRLLL